MYVRPRGIDTSTCSCAASSCVRPGANIWLWYCHVHDGIGTRATREVARFSEKLTDWAPSRRTYPILLEVQMWNAMPFVVYIGCGIVHQVARYIFLKDRLWVRFRALCVGKFGALLP